MGNAFSSNYTEYKSNGDKDKILSLKDYLNMIRPYLSHTINNHGDKELKVNGKLN